MRSSRNSPARPHLPFRQPARIQTIRITPSEDEFGQPYHRIQVVYVGDGETLDPEWLNGFRRRNQDKLAECGVNVTTESYLDTTNGPWSEIVGKTPEQADEL